MTDLQTATALLTDGEYTCVLQKSGTVYTSRERGVAPLVALCESGTDVRGASAADRVVGKATAFLYVRLGVVAVHARVLSRPAKEVLEQYGIAASYDTLTDGIINRRGDGPCPFEAAVLAADNAEDAYRIIRETQQKMRLHP